ncbi:MAG: DUF357 domain-containing protein [Candidatus Altiarchaeota archaeon]
MTSDMKAKVDLYLKKAGPRLEKLEITGDATVNVKDFADDFVKAVSCYYDDAKHFYEKGEYANALAALEYAEGWFDAGRKLGIFRSG